MVNHIVVQLLWQHLAFTISLTKINPGENIIEGKASHPSPNRQDLLYKHLLLPLHTLLQHITSELQGFFLEMNVYFGAFDGFRTFSDFGAFPTVIGDSVGKSVGSAVIGD